MAGRCASGLFELARDQKAVDAVKADLDRFDALLGESPDLMRLVRSPVFSAEQQAKALVAVLDLLQVSELTARFLGVVTANRRLFALRTIIKDVRALVAHYKGDGVA